MSVLVWESQPDNMQDPLYWNSGSFITGTSADAFRPLMIRGDVGNNLVIGDAAHWQGPVTGAANNAAVQTGRHADLEILGLVLIGLGVFLWYLTRRRRWANDSGEHRIRRPAAQIQLLSRICASALAFTGR